MKSIVIIIIATFFTGLMAYSQSTAVKLSNLTVMDVFTPASGEVRNFMIDFDATSSESLSRIEIKMENKVNPTDFHLVIIPIVLKDGKANLEFEKFNQPVEGNKIQFMQPVRNQLTEPYHRINVKGFDINGKETNQLNFERVN